WGQLRLVREMRQAAARQGQTLPADASVKRRIASWETDHSVPDEFYGPLLCEALGKTGAELGLNHLTGHDAQLLETRYPPAPESAIDSLTQLWRADLNEYEPLLHASPSEPAWSEASLRWLVTPEPSPPKVEARSGVRVGLAACAALLQQRALYALLVAR